MATLQGRRPKKQLTDEMDASSLQQEIYQCVSSGRAFAAYLGAVMVPEPNGWLGAVIALVAVFLPGLLLVYGTLPFWDAIRSRPVAQAAMRGANSAVVGILGAALYDPVWVNAVQSRQDFALALAGFLLLTVWRAPSGVVVVLLAIAGLLAGTL
jgi:chromate transporter